MAHVPLEELAKRIEDAKMEVEVGARYVHYKDPTKEYVITELAILEAAEEVAVVYQAQYDERVSFIRPLSSFVAIVDVDGTPTPRFTKV